MTFHAARPLSLTSVCSRRETIATLIALCAVPIAARAQPPGKAWRVGFLSSRPRPLFVDADDQTARALGISLPPALLLRADELIP